MFLSTKISFIGREESPCKNYYVSVARTLIFLWCIVTELPFSSSFWNDGDLSFYVILNALSCIRFILLWFSLWNSKTNGQYLNCDFMKASLLFSFFQLSWKVQGEQEHQAFGILSYRDKWHGHQIPNLCQLLFLEVSLFTVWNVPK